MPTLRERLSRIADAARNALEVQSQFGWRGWLAIVLLVLFIIMMIVLMIKVIGPNGGGFYA